MDITALLITIAQAYNALPVARSTFYDWRAEGRAPLHIKLLNRHLRLRATELDRWLEEREGPVLTARERKDMNRNHANQWRPTRHKLPGTRLLRVTLNETRRFLTSSSRGDA